MRSTFRILFMLRSRLNKDGSAPIMIRVTLDSERIEISSKMSIKPEQWSNELGKATGRSKHALETNNGLDFMRNRLTTLYNELLEKDGSVLLEKLRSRFLGIEEKRHTVLSLFDKKIAQKKALIGHGISEDTHDKYVCSKSKVEGFINYHYKREDLLIKEINYDFVSNYDIYLRSQHHCGHNTVVRHMRYLKQVTADAIKCHYLHVDPFTDIPLSSKKGAIKYLTETELQAIINMKFRSRRIEEARDVFVFCCYTGFALTHNWLNNS